MSQLIYLNLCFLQNISAERFAKEPIMFGDFMKIGAGREDQLYEELTDVKKVADVLQTVSNTHKIMFYISFIINKKKCIINH